MSVFDPAKFMEQNVDAGSTSFEPIPAGDYTAMIDDAVVRAAGDGVVIDITCLLQAPDVAAKLGRDRLQVKTGIFLDTTPNGGMDMSKGKNVRLNKLRDALGQNTPGWNIQKLKGAGPVKVTVGLRPDKNSPDVIYNDIKAFGKMK